MKNLLKESFLKESRLWIVAFKILNLLGIFYHIKAIWYQDLFGDEIHSLFFMKNNSWMSLLTHNIEPIHPNGIYILMKILYGLFPSVIFLRIGLFLIFLASIYVLWQILKEMKIRKENRWIGLALWSSSAYIWHFSFQLRMYGPAFLVGLLSILFLIKKKLTWSLIMDFLLLNLVYGGILLVVVKWIAYGLGLISDDKNKKNIKSWLWYFSLALLLVISILVNFAQNQIDINRSYLYWVKIPVIEDWSLALVSFLSGTFLPYFEGYANLADFWLNLGKWLNWSLVSLFLLILIISFKNREKLCSKFKKINFNNRFLIILSGLSLVFYTLVLGFTLVRGGHFFHIRQLFGIAIILWLFLIWLSGLLIEKKKWLVILIVLLIIAINQKMIIKDNFGDGQSYVHHFEALPGKPIIVSDGDIELIYKQCETFNRDEITEKCGLKEIYLTRVIENLESEMWWQTVSVTESVNLKEVECVRESIDFYRCKEG